MDYSEKDLKTQEQSKKIFFSNRKSILEKAINIVKDGNTYYEISISTKNKIIHGIKVDKSLIEKVKEYYWFVNNYNNIVVYQHLEGIKNKNKAIYQILFEDEIEKTNKETGYINIAYFINEDKLDNRRANIKFVSRRKYMSLNKSTKITGIYIY